MTDEQASRLEKKIDQLLELAPTIEGLGAILVRRQTATNRLELNKNTLSSHPGFEGIGENKTYIEVKEISVIRRRKRGHNRSK